MLPSMLFSLQLAVYEGDYEEVKSILASGIDVNAPIKDMKKDSTLLHMAPNTLITRELLLHGADVNAPNGFELTPLQVAALYSKEVGVIKELLAHGANINAQQPDGYTALTFAILFKDIDAIAELLKYDADFNIPAYSSLFQSATSLDIAVYLFLNCAKLIIKTSLLRKAKCDTQVIDLEPYRDCPNYTPLKKFQEECLREVNTMKIFEINKRLKLLEFITNRNLWKKPLYATKKNILAEVKLNFPIYSDIILLNMKACMERAGLFTKLKKLKFCAVSGQSTKQVVLDIDSMYYVYEYLSNKDIKKFINAFVKSSSSSLNLSKLRELSEIPNEENIAGRISKRRRII